jgi:hypothetical protein
MMGLAWNEVHVGVLAFISRTELEGVRVRR